MADLAGRLQLIIERYQFLVCRGIIKNALRRKNPEEDADNYSLAIKSPFDAGAGFFQASYGEDDLADRAVLRF